MEETNDNIQVLSDNAVPFLKEKVESLVADSLGKAKVLTTADYNYPENNPTGIASWQLEPGFYIRENLDVKVYPETFSVSDAGGSVQINTKKTYSFIVSREPAVNSSVIFGEVYFLQGSQIPIYLEVLPTGSYNTRLINWLTLDNVISSSTHKPLSANQGRLLYDGLKNIVMPQNEFNDLWENA